MIEIVLRCYHKKDFFPSYEFAIWCETTETLRTQEGGKYVIACCDNDDYCNRHLKPSFPSEITADSRGTNQSQQKTKQTKKSVHRTIHNENRIIMSWSLADSDAFVNCSVLFYHSTFLL